MEKKKCCTCKKVKDNKNFSKDKSRKDGLTNKCRECRKIQNSKNFDKRKEYYEKTKHYWNLKHKEYVNNNKEKFQNYQKEHYLKNKQQKRDYFLNNKEKIDNYTKEWRIKNPGYSAKLYKKYYDNDPQYKLSMLLRSRLKDAIKDKTKKSGKTETLLGCSFEECKKYLESLFKPEMTWENHGKVWEIDHIKPCSKFDLTDIEQQKICFHYTNLQPLFKTSDIAKSFGYINEIGNRNKSDK